MTSEFTQVQPSLENYWRAVVLFGRNVASYKFALACSLLDRSAQESSLIPLQELAEPFAAHIARHLQSADKQATSRSSRFLDTCRQFNRGEITQEQLRDATVKDGFNNVIDAFHVVGNGEIAVRFFIDERNGPSKGIRLTDEFYHLKEAYQARNLPQEVEARWRLVETAWELKLPRSAVVVGYDAEAGTLVAKSRLARRAAVARCRDALNGYQKGKCFYCFADVSLVDGSADLADVDHFIPHALKAYRIGEPLDGVWNLVLACQRCNRGAAGKFDLVPELRYLERLHRRNEFLIESHHPLRETLLAQTGYTPQDRVRFLNGAHGEAVRLMTRTWKPANEDAPAF